MIGIFMNGVPQVGIKMQKKLTLFIHLFSKPTLSCVGFSRGVQIHVLQVLDVFLFE